MSAPELARIAYGARMSVLSVPTLLTRTAAVGFEGSRNGGGGRSSNSPSWYLTVIQSDTATKATVVPTATGGTVKAARYVATVLRSWRAGDRPNAVAYWMSNNAR